MEMERLVRRSRWESTSGHNSFPPSTGIRTAGWTWLPRTGKQAQCRSGSISAESGRLAADQVLESFAGANRAPPITRHQDLRRPRPRIVIRRQHEPIRAGRADSKQIARRDVRDLAIARQKIARLADRPDHVGENSRPVR